MFNCAQIVRLGSDNVPNTHEPHDLPFSRRMGTNNWLQEYSVLREATSQIDDGDEEEEEEDDEDEEEEDDDENKRRRK